MNKEINIELLLTNYFNKEILILLAIFSRELSLFLYFYKLIYIKTVHFYI